jgi:RNA polymerase sigma-70 factor (ECF subfamily)
LSDPSAITSWIYTITSNTCLDTLSRRKSRKGDVPLVFEGETEDERYIDNATMTPEQAAEQSELRRCLEAALGGLDSSSRMTIVLRDVEDRPYQELANNFKIGLSAIKMRIQRARQAFRQVLQEVCPDAWQKGI